MGYLNTTLVKKAGMMYAENAGNVGSYTGGSYSGTAPASSGAGASGTRFTGPTPASSGAVAPAPAPANAPVSPNPAAGAAADDAAKAAWKFKGPISYGRRLQAIAHRATHDPMRAGKQGWQLVKTIARRNPKLAMLGLIGSSLAGGAMLGNVAASGRPPVRQSNAMNPYAGLETC